MSPDIKGERGSVTCRQLCIVVKPFCSLTGGLEGDAAKKKMAPRVKQAFQK